MNPAPGAGLHERYAEWERSAGRVALAAALAVATSLGLGPTHALTVAGAAIAGLLAFGSWRMALGSHQAGALACALLAAGVAVASLWPAIGQPGPVFYGAVLPQGLGSLVTTLFGCIHLARRIAKRPWSRQNEAS